MIYKFKIILITITTSATIIIQNQIKHYQMMIYQVESKLKTKLHTDVS